MPRNPGVIRGDHSEEEDSSLYIVIGACVFMCNRHGRRVACTQVNLAGYSVTVTLTRLVVQQHWNPPPPSPE